MCSSTTVGYKEARYVSMVIIYTHKYCYLLPTHFYIFISSTRHNVSFKDSNTHIYLFINIMNHYNSTTLFYINRVDLYGKIQFLWRSYKTWGAAPSSILLFTRTQAQNDSTSKAIGCLVC